MIDMFFKVAAVSGALIYLAYSLNVIRKFDSLVANPQCQYLPAIITAVCTEPLDLFTVTSSEGIGASFENYKYPDIDIAVGTPVYLEVQWFEQALPTRFRVVKEVPM